MKKMVASLAMLSGFVMVSGSLFAHHGTGAAYEMHKTIVVKGVITEFDYVNPHSQLYFDVTDDKGNVVHWSTEMTNPFNFQALGHNRKELMEKFVPGTIVTVTGSPSKNGTPNMLFGKAVVADGWCLCNGSRGGAQLPQNAPPDDNAAK